MYISIIDQNNFNFRRIIINISSIITSGLIFVLFFSGINKPVYVNEILPLEGKYSLKATGDINENLVGSIEYYSELKKSIKGKAYSIMRLKLRNSDEQAKHSMEFLISKINMVDKISKGTYKVVNKMDGFINCFDGVFGYANISALGEDPFFARQGKIAIQQVSKNWVQGYIEVKMENKHKEYFKIKGDFKAYKN